MPGCRCGCCRRRPDGEEGIAEEGAGEAGRRRGGGTAAVDQAVAAKKTAAKKTATKKTATKKTAAKKSPAKKNAAATAMPHETSLSPDGAAPAVLDRLYEVVVSRRAADPALSHSARLLSRGMAKVAQKFGEEAVECLIEAVAGNSAALIGESADVLYHLLVMWVAAEVTPGQVWQELERREGSPALPRRRAGRRSCG